MTDTTDTETTASTNKDSLLGALWTRGRHHLTETVQNPLVHLTTQITFVAYLYLGSVLFYTAPVVAQSGNGTNASAIGSVYCGTAVADGIGLLFGALAALGLPAAMFFTGRSGLKYMRATGNPNKKNQARTDLILSGVGFMVIVLAITAPELIDKMGSTLGFSFSKCVKPF